MTHSQWRAMPRWKKRLQGFASYLLCAFVALFAPEKVDRAMYLALHSQFEE